MKQGVVALVVAPTERRAPRNPSPTAQWSSHWSEEGPREVRPGLEAEPDLTLTLSPEDARLVMDGELAPSVAFMQGRLKTAGDNGLVLRVLRWTATPAFRDALAAWASSPGLRPVPAEVSPPARPHLPSPKGVRS
jgi:hypothetical protein